MESLAVALLLLTIGYLLVDLVVGDRQLDVIVKVSLALPAVMAVSFVFMMVHIATGGRFFANPAAVRIATGICLVVPAALRLRSRHPRAPVPVGPILALGGILLVALIVWCRAVFQLPPAARGDTLLHLGWASQLRNGDALPTNALTGTVPNYYPWLFHSLLAWVSTLIPGGRPFHSLGTLQLVQVFGSVTGLFTFGYLITRKWLAGVSVALMGALTGGFGILAPMRALIFEVRGSGSLVGSTWGDLMATRSFNLALHNLAPIYPREITYALVPTLLILFGLAVMTKQRSYLVVAGCLLGLIGLMGGEAFFVGISLAIVFVSVGGVPGRLRNVLCITIPAAAIYATWAVPLLFNYLHYGGFSDLSSLPVVLTWTQVLGGWGMVTPLAVVGMVLLVRGFRGSPPEGRLPLLYLGTVAVVLVAIIAIGESFGSGFETLGRAHRYWPLFFQACAICGGLGLAWLIARAAKLHVAVAAFLIALVASAAVASPLIASGLLGERKYTDPNLVEAIEDDGRSWLNVLSPRLGDDCVIAISTREKHMTVEAFAYSGYRMVTYVWTFLTENSARVRWRDIYAHIVPDAERQEDIQALSDPATEALRYTEILDKYDLDRIVVPAEFLGSPAIENYASEIGFRKDRPFAVLTTGDCT